MNETKIEQARKLRYKRPALSGLGYDAILSELWDINEACSEVQYFVDDDSGSLLDALEGDSDAEYEFRVAFSDLSGKAERLEYAIREYDIRQEFDDCTVALIGNRYKLVGFDSVEEDYFSLASYQNELAQSESGKRLMRHTKAEMISIVGQCLGVLIAFLDLRQSYDYLKATFDILRDENTSLLQMIRAIDAAYQAANEVDFCSWEDATKRFDRLLNALPERAWLE